MGKCRDLTGQKFGRLTVLRRAPNTKQGKAAWFCRCDCGATSVATRSHLIGGNTKSCGCAHPKKRLDLTGRTYGRLTVIAPADSIGGMTMWRCLCQCGAEVAVRTSSLRAGNTNSCGCLKNDSIRAISTIHGLSSWRIYKIWTGMKSRCSNPNNSHFSNYGGRGIAVCQEWGSFEAFYDWALTNGYQDDLTIERLDVNKNYEPVNCAWIPKSQQSYNTRSNRLIGCNGTVKTIHRWSKETGLPAGTIRARIDKLGWSIERAITEPVRRRKDARN